MSLAKKILLYLMSVFYILAGINHFISPDFYTKMMPSYLPLHLELVFISGVIEMHLGIALLFQQTRIYAAWGIIFLLIAVFPANINMAIHAEEQFDFSKTALYIRLPIQFLLMAWAWIYTKK
jgi:uncharacterized membrane protein